MIMRKLGEAKMRGPSAGFTRAVMPWLLRLMFCRAHQPRVVRWLEVIVLFALVFSARMIMGTLHGVNPAISFYPLLLIVSLLFGWLEAVAVLALAVAVGCYFFIPQNPGMYLLPVAWLFVGSLTISIISTLKMLARELASANERQRLLFRELQHRVANTLQSAVSTLELATMQIDTSPEKVKTRLENAAQRFSAAAEVHRRLHDPALVQQGLSTILLDAVGTVVDTETTRVSIDVTPLELSFDQVSIIAMLVIEAANNAQKHVFARNLGENLMISLRATSHDLGRLSVKDDGPGWSGERSERSNHSLGMTIIEGLSNQIGGTLSMKVEGGTEVSVMFPLSA